MKATILVLSLVFNLIALSVFGFFIQQKGGFTFVNEKITQVWESTFSKTATTSPAAESVSGLTAISLQPPETGKGKPLMQVLQERRSERSFADKALSLQELSNLLWAANGINRSDGRRTAPSARNVREFEIYTILKDGAFVYDPNAHRLLPIAVGDHRQIAGRDSYVAAAPVNLIYVADLSKINWTRDLNVKILIASLDAGFIAENAALFCASAGLNSVPRINIDTDLLSKALKLRPEQRIILATTVGYPKSQPCLNSVLTQHE